VRELVIVITDLYLRHARPGAAVAGAPGIEHAARFGARTSLGHGWREWLAHSLGRGDLAGVAPAGVAAAAAGLAVSPGGSRWIATPVQLTPGVSGVYLDQGGILRLSDAELAALALAFRDTFGDSGCTLTPLPSGEFLLEAPAAVVAVPTLEPARAAGLDVAEALPRGEAARPLRRLLSEIEMWLYGLPLNEARARRGESSMTALWVWGAAGRPLAPNRESADALPRLYGTDAYVCGLWRLEGSGWQPLPETLDPVLAEGQDGRTLMLLEAGRELGGAGRGTLAEALARLDAHFISPAVRALESGGLATLTLIANDTLRALRRGDVLRFWRRRVGLEGFA